MGYAEQYMFHKKYTFGYPTVGRIDVIYKIGYIFSFVAPTIVPIMDYFILTKYIDFDKQDYINILTGKVGDKFYREKTEKEITESYSKGTSVLSGVRI